METTAGHFPDFLGIGATRGGSSWLYRVLSRHPDVWMPPVKELHYFDKPHDGRRTVSLGGRVPLVRMRDYLSGERKRSTGDSLAETVRWDLRYFFGRRSLEWYQSLFRPRAGQITGEVTPAYAKLEPQTIARIAELNPQIKALYMLRNPIDRAWSAVVNDLARKRRRNIADVPNDELVRKVERVARSQRSDYAANIRNWRGTVGADRLFIGYMEEIKEQPEDLLVRICEFLGISKPSEALKGSLLERVNTTSKFGGAMPPEVRRRLAEMLLPKIEETAALLGGYAENWLAEARELVVR